MSDQFSGMNVLVTGSTRNLGLAIARAFADGGADVVLHGPSQEEVDPAVAQLKAEAPEAKVHGIGFNLMHQGEIDDAFAELERRDLLPDILVNNAAHLGLGESGFLEQAPEFFRRVLEVNLFGPMRCSQLAAVQMKRRGGGAIINISSLAGARPIHNRIAYSTSKAALDGLTRAMSLDLAPYGIRVNAIAPGYVWTPRWETLSAEACERRKGNIPCGKSTKQEEIAALVLFLASGKAPSLQGECIVIDGGLSVQQAPKDVSV